MLRCRINGTSESVKVAYKPSNLNSKGTEVADPLRPLKEWDWCYELPTGKEHSPPRKLGSTIQLVSCDSLRARIAHQFQ